MRELLGHGQLVVPPEDEQRFFNKFYPPLRQRVHAAPRDASVTLPEPQAPSLLLIARHLDGHQLTLDWQWQYSLGDARRQEPLWPPYPSAGGRDLAEEATVLARAMESAAAMPELCEATLDGSRLASSALLEGLATVRFVADVLPRLSALTELTIETHGSPASYREAEAAPLVAISGSPSSSDRDWFDLGITVTVEGREVPFTDLFVALAHRQSHLLLADGAYFSLDKPELAALARLIGEARALQDQPDDGLRISRFPGRPLGGTGRPRRGGSPGRRVAGPGTRAAFCRPHRGGARARDGQRAAAPLPARRVPVAGVPVVARARRYPGRRHGARQDAAGPGAAPHAKDTWREGENRPPFLIVAPTSVLANWSAEARRFAPDLAVTVVSDTLGRRGGTLADVTAGADAVVTSYTLLRLDYEAYGAQRWAGLILDEAQYVKNHLSKAYQCARRVPAPFKLAITGTPMENNLMELWSLLSIAAPGLFPSPDRFSELLPRARSRSGATPSCCPSYAAGSGR